MQLESTKNKKLKIKFWLYCIYFLLLAGLTHTQTTTWQKIFNGPFPTLNDYGYASCRADGDNIYVLGSIQNA